MKIQEQVQQASYLRKAICDEDINQIKELIKDQDINAPHAGLGCLGISLLKNFTNVSEYKTLKELFKDPFFLFIEDSNPDYKFHTYNISVESTKIENVEWTMLQYASACGKSKTVKFLLEKKVNYEIKDVFGNTALEIAKVTHELIEKSDQKWAQDLKRTIETFSNFFILEKNLQVSDACLNIYKKFKKYGIICDTSFKDSSKELQINVEIPKENLFIQKSILNDFPNYPIIFQEKKETFVELLSSKKLEDKQELLPKNDLPLKEQKLYIGHPFICVIEEKGFLGGIGYFYNENNIIYLLTAEHVIKNDKKYITSLIYNKIIIPMNPSEIFTQAGQDLALIPLNVSNKNYAFQYMNEIPSWGEDYNFLFGRSVVLNKDHSEYKNVLLNGHSDQNVYLIASNQKKILKGKIEKLSHSGPHHLLNEPNSVIDLYDTIIVPIVPTYGDSGSPLVMEYEGEIYLLGILSGFIEEKKIEGQDIKEQKRKSYFIKTLWIPDPHHIDFEMKTEEKKKNQTNDGYENEDAKTQKDEIMKCSLLSKSFDLEK